jgi:citrate synthase
MAITTGIGLNNAIASAVNVLGDVHGGAGQACLELLYEIDRRHSDGVLLDEAVSQVLAHERAAGRRFVPGFGHRFHPIDPRVAPLEELVREASREGAVDGRFVAIGRALESGVSERVKQTIPMNIDGITAVVFAELGFAAPLARGLFVLSRSVGILAHAWEQSQQESRLKGPIPPHFLYAYDGPAERHLERRA